MKFTAEQTICFSIFWSIVLVGIPTAAYVWSGGPLIPGWAIFPAITAVLLFCLFIVLSGTKDDIPKLGK